MKQTKYCSRCFVIKNVSEFYLKNRTKNILRSECKKCTSKEKSSVCPVGDPSYDFLRKKIKAAKVNTSLPYLNIKPYSSRSFLMDKE